MLKKSSIFTATVFTFTLLASALFPVASTAQSASKTSARAACDGVFIENNGLVIMEIESAPLSDEWVFSTSIAGYTGSGYYEWEPNDGSNTIISPGKGKLTYNIQITKTGTYRFLYRTAAPHSTEHNDAWIRFQDNPVEARTDAGDVIDLGQNTWFKVYQGLGGDNWNHAAHTQDGPHQVYAIIDTPGTYRLQVSARSTQFKMDRLSLYHYDTVSYGTATNTGTGESQCLLPVELTSFDGLVDGDDVILNWRTASELNNAGFDVEFSSSADGPFSKIGFVTGGGTADEAIDYQYRHNISGLAGQTVYYRLKQVDFDGAFEYSDVVTVHLPAPVAASLHPAYPNPFNPTTTLSFTLPVEGKINLTIYDAMGRQVQELVNGILPAGYHTRTFEATGMANGTYIYRLETPAQTLTGSVLLLK